MYRDRHDNSRRVERLDQAEYVIEKHKELVTKWTDYYRKKYGNHYNIKRQVKERVFMQGLEIRVPEITFPFTTETVQQ